MIIQYKCSYQPKYSTVESSGFDIESAIDIQLKAGEFYKIPTGLSINIPKNYEIQIRSRSGLASKGIVVLNSPGTIDSDYNNEIHIILINHSKVDYCIQQGDRIAQGVLSPTIRAEFIKCDFTLSDRGGFGSTGK